MASFSNRRIIGIDPGSLITGFGIIDDFASDLHCVKCGVLRPVELKKRHLQESNLPDRLLVIFDGIVHLIQTFRPTVMAVESVFHAKNAQSALKLGHARGAALLAAANCNLAVYEYTPREIKKGVTGSGAASKEQVKKMVRLLVSGEISSSMDATDALSVAIFHSQHSVNLGQQTLRP